MRTGRSLAVKLFANRTEKPARPRELLRKGRSPFSAKSVWLAAGLIIGGAGATLSGPAEGTIASWFHSLSASVMTLAGSYLAGFFIGWGARRTIRMTSIIAGIALALIFSMFMHGGIMHLLGNMLYLHIFGDNIENLLGHLRYTVFYLFCGILASLAHVFSSVALGANLLIPSLGASGAISGVLGGYLLLFPKRRVRVLFLRSVIQLPALMAIGVWFLFQLISSLGMFSGGSGGGVAYGAHIGGFIAGMLVIKLFAITRSPATRPG